MEMGETPNNKNNYRESHQNRTRKWNDQCEKRHDWIRTTILYIKIRVFSNIQIYLKGLFSRSVRTFVPAIVFCAPVSACRSEVGHVDVSAGRDGSLPAREIDNRLP